MPKVSNRIDPYWTTTDGATVKMWCGDALEVLKALPSLSVQMIVTSPPYWGLRNYKAGSKEIGLEETPEQYVDRLVAVFHEGRRVLRDDGTLWLNLGDSYGGGGAGGLNSVTDGNGKGQGTNRGSLHNNRVKTGLNAGQLVGVPWQVAFALQRDGWILRQDIIWHKPSPMPESVDDRCTRAHEYVFLLAKSKDYYYDHEAIKQDSTGGKYRPNPTRGEAYGAAKGANGRMPDRDGGFDSGGMSNRRSVWTVAQQGYKGAHYACFPPKLIMPCILAGSSEKACAQCFTPWRRVVSKRKRTRYRPNNYTKRTGEDGTGNSCANSVDGVETRTIGWYPHCDCEVTSRPAPEPKFAQPDEPSDEELERHTKWEAVVRPLVESATDLETVPSTVLDPFFGAGTTGLVCVENNRRCWGIELNQDYLNKNAIPRVQGAILQYPHLAHLLKNDRPVRTVGRSVT